MTGDDFFKLARKIATGDRPPEPRLIISYARYEAARKAEAAGASSIEVMAIAIGASPEQAKKMAEETP